MRCRLSRARPPLPPPPPTPRRRPYHLARRPARPVRCGPSTNISIDERPPPAPVARHRTFAPPLLHRGHLPLGCGYGWGWVRRGEQMSGRHRCPTFLVAAATGKRCCRRRTASGEFRISTTQPHDDINDKTVIDRRLRPRCCDLGSYFKRPKNSPVRPLACNCQLVLQRTVYSQAQGSAELSVSPFCVTQPNPTQPTTSGKI